jgi:predicted acyltransferase
MSATAPATNRIASLDQFRGYTVAGMFVVNFLGFYAATPLLLKHHNTFCSYADTIMPQFFFAVGFAFRLTFGRRAQAQGLAAAYWHVIRRLLGLALIAMVVYTAPTVAKSWSQLVAGGAAEAIRTALASSIRTWFQTLMHIAVTSLWILPVIRAGALVRIAYMAASAALHVALSHWFYYDWVQSGGIDGGVLGFLTWCIPTLMGTLACDAVISPQGRPRLAAMVVWGVLLMAGGWLLSCGTTLYNVSEHDAPLPPGREWALDPVVPDQQRLTTHALALAEPPFVAPPRYTERQENYWMMSQRGGTLSYHVFAAGLSLALYVLFYLACDVWSWQLGVFRTLGTNALVAYILHGMVDDAVSPFIPRDAPLWYVTCGFLVFFGITYLFIRHLEKSGIYLKL